MNEPGTIGFRTRAVIEVPSFSPPANWIGGTMLRRLVEARLRSEGLVAGRMLIVGELNRALGRIEVSDVRRALNALVNEFTLAGIAFLAEVAWFDAGEGIWRIVHPENSKGEMAFDFATGNEMEKVLADWLLVEKTAKSECARQVAEKIAEFQRCGQ